MLHSLPHLYMSKNRLTIEFSSYHCTPSDSIGEQLRFHGPVVWLGPYPKSVAGEGDAISGPGTTRRHTRIYMGCQLSGLQFQCKEENKVAIGLKVKILFLFTILETELTCMISEAFKEKEN